MNRMAAFCVLLGLSATGCYHGNVRPSYDRPFPLGAVTDVFWETQQTNAEATDFILYDHEFKGNTAQLAPLARRHLEEIAVRLEHVPFAVVIEQSQHNARPELDQTRRRTVIEHLARMGVTEIEGRVIVAPAFVEGLTSQESEAAYYQTLNGGLGRGGGAGRRFGGTGGFYR